MPTIYDLYEFYLEPSDLGDKAHVVTVESVKVAKYYNQRTRSDEHKVVLRFKNRRKAMILNKTQAGAMEKITGRDDYTRWVGAEIVLVEGSHGGKRTITITTREGSGDLDLMFPQKKPMKNVPTVGRVPVPAGWWDMVAVGGEAVKYAASVWKCDEAEAWGRIDRAIQAEDISDAMPPDQAKQWVDVVHAGGAK